MGNVGAAMGVASIIIMTLMVTSNVLLRYGLDKPLLFADEYSGYLLVLIAFMGFAYTARQGAHVSVDIVTRRLSKRPREILDMITTVILIVLVVIYLRFGWAFWIRFLEGDVRATTTYLTPLWIPATPIWLGLGFLISELLTHLVKTFNSFRRG